MERHLEELWLRGDTDPRWREPQPSFKTTRIAERGTDLGGRLVLEFCHSTWHQFLGTNQAASKDWESPIKLLLQRAPAKGWDLARSPFSNNLGFVVAIIDAESRTLYYSRRKLVSVHANKKSTAVGTQLHAYSKHHVTEDGRPDIFRAVYRELWNEGGIRESDVRDLYIAAWGIGTRTGTPELLFVCDSRRPLYRIREDVIQARVPHHPEFDKIAMEREGKDIVLDYELLADLRAHADE